MHFKKEVILEEIKESGFCVDLYLYQRNTEVGRMSISKEEFIKNLGKIMDNEVIQELDELYGEGGSNVASTLLVEKLQLKFPNKYGNMVTNLNNLKKKRI